MFTKCRLLIFVALGVLICGDTIAVEKVIWDAWYTVTVGEKNRYSYFNERFANRDGRMFYQMHSWKNEEGFVNQEELGALAEASPLFAPLFWNYHSNYRSTEITIDGNVRNGKSMTVKIRKGNSDLQPVVRNVPGKTILSVFFPLWLGDRLKELKPGKGASFSAIQEDSIEGGFSTQFGRITLEKPDEFCAKTKTSRVVVDYRDMKSVWYVDKNGMPIRIVMPRQKTIIEKVTKQQAEKFLENE